MKKLIFYSIILMSFICTSCITGNSTKTFNKETQEEFNQNAIYFIKTDGPKLIQYLDNDTSLSIRDKQPTKRRYNNLIDLINQMENKE